MNKGRFVVLILDGFGVGAMPDVQEKRPDDLTAYTAKSILDKFPRTHWKQFETLGLMNILKYETQTMKYSKEAIVGKCHLIHEGADTFLGHQEIMGTKPPKTHKQNFQQVKQKVYDILIQKGYHIRTISIEGLEYFIVNECVSIADNIDSDLGQAINCIATLDNLSFEELLKIANIVRGVVTHNRVIAFGGKNVTIQNIIDATEIKEGAYIGNLAVKTGVYNHGYEVRHLGYGVDEKKQVPYLLGQNGIDVTLIGKVADVCQNHFGRSINCVDTSKVMDYVILELEKMKSGFICANVQETDLAGHSMNTKWYHDVLSIVNDKLEKVFALLNANDILLICADHGNDPEIGHNRHTREQVPIMIKHSGKNIFNIGERRTLSDIAATVCDYFHVQGYENGESMIIKESS